MKTKLTIRIKKRNGEYVKGYKEATKYFLGFANDRNDNTLIHLTFGDDFDSYFKIEKVVEMRKKVGD